MVQQCLTPVLMTLMMGQSAHSANLLKIQNPEWLVTSAVLAAIQRDLDTLEKWDSRKSMNSNVWKTKSVSGKE